MTDTTHAHPREALDAAIDAARIANPIITPADGREHALVPHGYALHDVTDPHRLPPMIRAAVTMDDRASLSAYANRFSDTRSILLADIDKGTIRACLDWHHNNEAGLAPQHATHRATLQLRDSEEFKRWDEMEGEMHPQTNFAMFLEENVSDVVNPAPSVLLEICRDLEATQGVKFRSGVRLDNGDRTFVYQDETHVKNDITVPTEITLSIPLYQGEAPIEAKAKFRFRPTPDGLMLGFRWHRVKYQRDATFTEIAHKIAEETGLPAYFGRTAP